MQHTDQKVVDVPVVLVMQVSQVQVVTQTVVIPLSQLPGHRDLREFHCCWEISPAETWKHDSFD